MINKVCYSSSAWWGFTTAADRQRLNAFIRRCKRQGYCATDLELENVIAEADETLFQKILRNPSHVLAPLLPDKVNTKYQFRHRKHNRQMIPKTSSIHSFNFIIRIQYTADLPFFIILTAFKILSLLIRSHGTSTFSQAVACGNV